MITVSAVNFSIGNAFFLIENADRSQWLMKQLNDFI